MKVARVLTTAVVLVLAACTPSSPRPPKVTELPAEKWTKIEPGGDTRCANGAPYAFWVRPGEMEDKLLICFQGGGMCWKEENCLRDEGYDHFVSCDDHPENLRGIFDFDHQNDRHEPDNPFASYSVVFIPYCTGDLHWGDCVVTYQKDNGCQFRTYHRGYVNAQSALEWVYENYPAPESTLVTGCSAGSVGSILHAAHIARHYPDSVVTQLGDSAAQSPPFNFDAKYGARQNFPPDCPGLEGLPDSFTLAQFYVAVAQCNPGQTLSQSNPVRIFSQFNFADDQTQKCFYENLLENPASTVTITEVITTALHEIDLETQNFYYYTVLNPCLPRQTCHCILNKDLFYRLKVDEIPLRDWVQLVASGTVTSSIFGTATIDLGP